MYAFGYRAKFKSQGNYSGRLAKIGTTCSADANPN